MYYLKQRAGQQTRYKSPVILEGSTGRSIGLSLSHHCWAIDGWTALRKKVLPFQNSSSDLSFCISFKIWKEYFWLAKLNPQHVLFITHILLKPVERKQTGDNLIPVTHSKTEACFLCEISHLFCALNVLHFDTNITTTQHQIFHGARLIHPCKINTLFSHCTQGAASTPSNAALKMCCLYTVLLDRASAVTQTVRRP